MKSIDFENLNVTDCVGVEVLVEKFQEYCKDILGYSQEEAEIASIDIRTHYSAPFVFEEYEMMLKLDGIEYEVRSCYTDFSSCGLFYLGDVEPFEFYVLYDMTTIKNNTVAEYKQAKKLFVI